MNLPELPELDHSDLDALQSSAAYRAEVAVHVAESPMFWKGLELKLTPSRKSLFMMLQKLDGIAESGGDRMERDAIILLYLCSQTPDKWTDPQLKGGKLYSPLRSRPSDWLAAIDDWADSTITNDDLLELNEVVDRLWLISHAPRVVTDNEDSQPEKKTLIPIGN